MSVQVESNHSRLPLPPREMEGKRIFIGICSCRKHATRRQGVRETWFPHEAHNTTAMFFVGKGRDNLDREADTVVLDVDDGYMYLPGKVLGFFRYALIYHQFDWLFKCDDDTYVVIERLRELTVGGHEHAGNEFLAERGAASGGAGYLLSRRMVEMLVEDDSLPSRGYEDLILSGAAVEKCAHPPLCTSRLGMDAKRVPSRDNDLITCHYMTPQMMLAAHMLLTALPDGKIDVEQPQGKKRILLYENGVFVGEEGNGFGQWDINSEANLNLKYYGPQTHITCPLGPLNDQCVDGKKKVGVLLIATSRYRSFIWASIQAIRRNFLPGHDRTIFLFTDVSYPEAEDLRVIRIPHRPWPEVTLFCYAVIRENASVFLGMDYLYYMDADVRVDGYVGEEIFSDSTAVLHPGYLDCRLDKFPYEGNPESRAFVEQNTGKNYFSGAVLGGSKKCFLQAADALADRIDDDWCRGIIASLWEESHWNRYLIDNPPAKVLSSSYCYPEDSNLPGPRKITALNKDHAAFQNLEPDSVWPEKIVAHLRGGLGNQMFQYAQALALALRLGAVLEVAFHPSKRAFALGQFGVRITDKTAHLIKADYDNSAGYHAGVEDEIWCHVIGLKSVKIGIRGYFQNERFFSGVADEIRRVFYCKPCLPVSPGGRTPVCVQIRRGDYLQACIGICSSEYYRMAMKIIAALVKDPLFFVVSDDLCWCREFFEGDPDVFVPTSQSEIEGMETMAACKAFVISNSTYGWWGAWLSGAALVIAPEPWMADKSWDIVPSRWIKLPVTGVGNW